MAKILFVCSGNVGRSQMAEAFYNQLTKSQNAFSAGIDPNTPLKYPEIPSQVRLVMAEEEIDVSRQKVKLINRCQVGRAAQIFVMCQKEDCPAFLINSGKVVYWQIEDPYQLSLDDLRRIRDQIKVKIESIL